MGRQDRIDDLVGEVLSVVLGIVLTTGDPMMTRPVAPSLLISPEVAVGGAVHSDVTLATFGKFAAWSTIAQPGCPRLGGPGATGRGDGEHQLHITLMELVAEHVTGAG